ncbi:MAG: hypothetical protein KKA10_18435, partial [Euryarchaeota archaeon]|nr:hypothetical protein [Euryarchaeota archaeon]
MPPIISNFIRQQELKRYRKSPPEKEWLFHSDAIDSKLHVFLQKCSEIIFFSPLWIISPKVDGD